MPVGTYQTSSQSLGQSGLPLATWSPCKNYRYTLRRVWRSVDEPRVVTWVLLNPSTADEFTSDPTIRRCMGFSQEWGFDELMIVNAYGLRSTDPRGLWKVDDPVGPDNDQAILTACRRASLVVCGWGRHLRIDRRVELTRLLLPGYHAADRFRHMQLTALQFNADGSPAHPLYLRGDLKPRPFNLAEAGRG